MIGLIILVVGIVYLALLIWATRLAYRWAKAKGLSKAKCRLAAAGGFLAVYLPVFWDHIPTLIAHQYYCNTEAGFWVYKTPEQWKKENPGVAETLVRQAHTRLHINAETGMQTNYLNKRFLSQTSYKRLVLIPITIATRSTIDEQTGERLVTRVSVGSGYGNMMTSPDWRSMKFWLNLETCAPGLKDFTDIENTIYKWGEPQ